MHSPDSTSDSPLSVLGDPQDSGVATTRRSGRRAAAVAFDEAVETASSVDTASSVATAPRVATAGLAPVSPRRAARAAREAQAALSSQTSSQSSAPQSPVIAPETLAAVSPVGFDAAAPQSPAIAPETMAAATLAAVTGAAAATRAAAPAATPVVLSIASTPGRRQSFVAAAPTAQVAVAPRRRVVRTLRTTSSAAASNRPAASTRGRAFSAAARRVTIVTVVTGILATSILPVLAHSQGTAYAAGTAGAAAPVADTASQSFDVSASVDNAVSARDGYGATSVLDYESQVIANRQAQKNSVYTGPTTAEYLAHPLYSTLDRAEVFQVALQYLGTPYVHGGEDPSAFDCSGLITFVYAQFGISLPHYVPSQDAVGRTIPESEAVPGDLVIFNSDDHDGIYAGNGMILDAPKPGGYVSVRPIWSAPHHFVRIDG